MEIQTPKIFNYTECLRYLNRSPNEILYEVKNDCILKLIEVEDEKILFQISRKANNILKVDFLNVEAKPKVKQYVKQYISEWFDFATPLDKFYASIEDKPILSNLSKKYFGLRLIRVPDLFEALSWSIIGQQINLNFAYQVKRNLVAYCENSMVFNEKKYYLFPKPQQILNLNDEDLKLLKFSRQKITYIKEVANCLNSGLLSKENLLEKDWSDIKGKLISIKGIGAWSANYVMMRCLGDINAFPFADVGLHNAIKQQFQLAKKPSSKEVLEIAETWPDWKAYITFYLWRSLLD